MVYLQYAREGGSFYENLYTLYKERTISRYQERPYHAEI
jgi:hypothetical protein